MHRRPFQRVADRRARWRKGADAGCDRRDVHRFRQSRRKPNLSARLSLQIEDIAAVGQENFESILRENLSLDSQSDELDDQVINGDRPANPSDDETLPSSTACSKPPDRPDRRAVRCVRLRRLRRAPMPAGLKDLWSERP